MQNTRMTSGGARADGSRVRTPMELLYTSWRFKNRIYATGQRTPVADSTCRVCACRLGAYKSSRGSSARKISAAHPVRLTAVSYSGTVAPLVAQLTVVQALMVQTRKQRTAMQVSKEALTHDSYVLILAPTPPPAASFFARCTEVSHEFARAVEEALRLRHPSQPAQLPRGFDTWLQKLLFDERRSEIHVPALSVGTAHAATVHAGRVFVWGTEYVSMAGRECPGMLGYGMRSTTRHVFDNDLRVPTPLANVTSAVSVSCGRKHTLVLSSEGSVHAFGNGEWGQCGTAKGRAKMDFFPDNAQPARFRGKGLYTQCSTFGLLKDGYNDIDTLYSIKGDLPYMHCAECQPCFHPPRQISGAEMSGNYDSTQGHPYGPFGM
eukprot:5860831-Prymnesium_polylepis.1